MKKKPLLCRLNIHKERQREPGNLMSGTHCVRCKKKMGRPIKWPKSKMPVMPEGENHAS